MAQSGQSTKPHILIVARPGPLRDSLAALLSALPKVGRVSQAADPEAALRLMAANRPHLVVVDFDPAGESQLTLLHTLRRRFPATRCLALAGDVDQKNMIEGLLADAVLLKGTPAAGMIALVERLLDNHAGTTY